LALANPGVTLAIKGLCQQSVSITSAFQSGILITNETGVKGAALVSDDGIEGQVEIGGPIQVTISGISLTADASDLGAPGVLSVTGANVAIINAEIADGWRNGIVASGNAVVSLLNTTVSGNGHAGIAGQGDGIRASNGTHVFLGQHSADGSADAANAVTVSGNAGNGVSVQSDSSVEMAGGAIEGNEGIELLVSGSSSANIFDAQIRQTGPFAIKRGFAVEVFQASRVALWQGAAIDAGVFGGGAFVSSASSLMMLNSRIVNATTNQPTARASGGSEIVLAGGDTLANAAGPVVGLDHSASLVQGQGTELGPAMSGEPLSPTPPGDTITGNGVISLESNVELGFTPSIPVTWNGNLSVILNSALRLDGGATLTGAVLIEHSSYGFFLGANVIAGGVTCPAGAANSHVLLTAGASVLTAWSGGSNAVAMTPAANGCLGF
jgi:hypothetical protein